MATVLLIITIPTELEELRKRQEQLARRQDVELSIGRSSFRESENDNETNDKPHIHEAVKKAILLLNTSQQRHQSSVYPRASEIFDLKPMTVTPKNANSNAKAEVENDSIEIAVDQVENRTSKDPINESTSKTASREIFDETFTVNNPKVKQKKTNTTTIEPDIHDCLETVMRVVLKELGITNALWTQTSDGRMYQILFTISFDEAYEELLCELHDKGVGERAGSTIAVLNCIASKKPVVDSHNGSRNDDPIENPDDPSSASNEYCSRQRSGNRSQSRYRKSIWERFMNSVRSRLNIAQIIRCVRQDAMIDFDFMILLISAALLSAFGLMDDSLVFLASSMLISPLMGPIIAAIFGTAINDPVLRNMGIRNECYGIMISLIVGFFFGVFVCTFNSRFQSMEGITSEMKYRGELHTLIMCSIAAVPSGAAVAIGILNGNMGSLIGVAISASLLPPAVNSGMLWAMVVFCLAGEISTKGFGIREKYYFDDITWDFIAMSGVSIGITILNILLVFTTGVVLLKVKEIVPGIGGVNQEFWKRDIKIARNISQQNLTANAAILEELSNLPSEDRNAMGINCDMLRCMQVPDGPCQHTWSPGYLNFENRSSMHSGYATVHRLDYLYSTITQQGFNVDDFSTDFASSAQGAGGGGGGGGGGAGTSNTRRNEYDTVCRNAGPFKYIVCNEREARGGTPAATEGGRSQTTTNTQAGATNTERNMPQSSHNRDPPVGQVRRFFITPVEASEYEPNEYDA